MENLLLKPTEPSKAMCPPIPLIRQGHITEKRINTPPVQVLQAVLYSWEANSGDPPGPVAHTVSFIEQLICPGFQSQLCALSERLDFSRLHAPALHQQGEVPPVHP